MLVVKVQKQAYRVFGAFHRQGGLTRQGRRQLWADLCRSHRPRAAWLGGVRIQV